VRELHERGERLAWLAAAPGIWVAHFLSCYLTAAIWCAKTAERGGSIDAVRLAIATYTALALAAIAVVGWIGYRRHGRGTASMPHDLDSPEDRHRFLGLATLLLAAMSAVATCYVALASVFFRSCL
jgi:hypothetical protein